MTACTRSRRLSFLSTLATWVFTVCSVMYSSVAISALDSLRATRPSTSRSRSVSWAGWVAAWRASGLRARANRPLGLTAARAPAQSPLPGHRLAAVGPAGHEAAIVLLITVGVAIAESLVIRPPADITAAARRLALGLALMFALSPATRFGYFAYPLGLLGWIALSRESTPDLT